MNKKFRYDYTHKFIFINIFVIPIFLAIFFALYSKDYALHVVWGIGVGDYLFKTFVFTFNQGITVKKSYIKVVDNLSVFKIKWDTLDHAEFKELKKKKKDNLYGFFHEFFYPGTYMSYCDYVYNNGKVFTIIFRKKDGGYIETYFGWMYKEKKLARVNKVTKNLEELINEINQIIKEKNGKNNLKRLKCKMK